MEYCPIFTLMNLVIFVLFFSACLLVSFDADIGNDHQKKIKRRLKCLTKNVLLFYISEDRDLRLRFWYMIEVFVDPNARPST